MKIPPRLSPLVEDGLIDEVIRQLMSGKEAVVFVVRCGDDVRCAKVYKEANQRSFRQNVLYQEGRKVKNSRQARAMEKGSKYGRKVQEEAWQSHEVDTLHRLAAVGIRVPKPYNFYEGVLLMELVTGDDGNAAPRLNDVELSEAQALEYHAFLINQVVRMLCTGVIHGDLSEFNILVGSDGPVIIDLPQAVDAAGNNNAKSMLERDVDNLAAYFGRFAPQLLTSQYGKEIWDLYEHGLLNPEVTLTGQFRATQKKADVAGVMREINAAQAVEDKKRLLIVQAQTEARTAREK
ncbi:MAG TPA: PA4780 family RIO1-like protein kinase [Methylophilaceae bacterium]|nr:PA4780 family RIO1-like protein kinase [Methylophilaceae bacterium]